MKTELLFTDFKKIMIDEEYQYRAWNSGDIQICLEPCLEGCDVAIYKDGCIMEPKYCTKLEDYPSIVNPKPVTPQNYLDILSKGMAHANKLYKKYVYKD